MLQIMLTVRRICSNLVDMNLGDNDLETLGDNESFEDAQAEKDCGCGPEGECLSCNPDMEPSDTERDRMEQEHADECRAHGGYYVPYEETR